MSLPAQCGSYRLTPLWWVLGTSAEAPVFGGELFNIAPGPFPFLSSETLEGYLRESSSAVSSFGSPVMWVPTISVL